MARAPLKFDKHFAKLSRPKSLQNSFRRHEESLQEVSPHATFRCALYGHELCDRKF